MDPFGLASNMYNMHAYFHSLDLRFSDLNMISNVGEGLVRANEQRCSTIHLFVMTPRWLANEGPVIKSRDLSRPIRVQHYEWDTLWPLDTDNATEGSFQFYNNDSV